jgi:hypothetical protein
VTDQLKTMSIRQLLDLAQSVNEEIERRRKGLKEAVRKAMTVHESASDEYTLCGVRFDPLVLRTLRESQVTCDDCLSLIRYSEEATK